jgi:hypothetical protein
LKSVAYVPSLPDTQAGPANCLSACLAAADQSPFFPSHRNGKSKSARTTWENAKILTISHSGNHSFTRILNHTVDALSVGKNAMQFRTKRFVFAPFDRKTSLQAVLDAKG